MYIVCWIGRFADVLLENAPQLDMMEAEKWVRPLVLLLADSLALDDTAQMAAVLSTLTALCQTGNRKVASVFCDRHAVVSLCPSDRPSFQENLFFVVEQFEDADPSS